MADTTISRTSSAPPPASASSPNGGLRTISDLSQPALAATSGASTAAIRTTTTAATTASTFSPHPGRVAHRHHHHPQQQQALIPLPASQVSTLTESSRLQTIVTLVISPFLQGMFYGLGEGAARVVLKRYWGIEALGVAAPVAGSAATAAAADKNAKEFGNATHVGDKSLLDALHPSPCCPPPVDFLLFRLSLVGDNCNVGCCLRVSHSNTLLPHRTILGLRRVLIHMDLSSQCVTVPIPLRLVPPPLPSAIAAAANSDSTNSSGSSAASGPDRPRSVHLFLFADVRNAAHVKKLVIQGDPSVPDSVMVNPAAVVDVFQVQLACMRALSNQELGTMKTRSLLSEILYSFSPSMNISESMKQFGLADSTKQVLVLVLDNREANTIPKDDGVVKEAFGKLQALIQGKAVALSELERATDPAVIRKVFKLGTELNAEQLRRATISALAVKGYL
ncbi:kinase binding protein CGI-121-domain-containing protein [Zopfochytrium polystomum]|nr:kinase binding protein CGI-121-domain-containing protein [Zopfochytrium polystomum]